MVAGAPSALSGPPAVVQVLLPPTLDLLRVCAGAPTAFSGPPAYVQVFLRLSLDLLWTSCYGAGAPTSLAAIAIVSFSSRGARMSTGFTGASH